MKLFGRKTDFLSGLFVGMIFVLVLVGGALFILGNKGLVVKIETGELAHFIGKEVKRQAVDDLPKIVAKLKSQVPSLVREKVKTGQLQAEIRISDVVNIILPPSALEQMDNYLLTSVEKTVNALLDNMDLTALAVELGDKTTDLVKYTLKQELMENTSLNIKTWWGTVPVFLEIQAGECEIENQY
jgi:hypothetical protein